MQAFGRRKKSKGTSIITADSAVDILDKFPVASEDNVAAQMLCLKVVLRPAAHSIEQVKMQVSAFKAKDGAIYKSLRYISSDITGPALVFLNSHDSANLTTAKAQRLADSRGKWLADTGVTNPDGLVHRVVTDEALWLASWCETVSLGPQPFVSVELREELAYIASISLDALKAAVSRLTSSMELEVIEFLSGRSHGLSAFDVLQSGARRLADGVPPSARPQALQLVTEAGTMRKIFELSALTSKVSVGCTEDQAALAKLYNAAENVCINAGVEVGLCPLLMEAAAKLRAVIVADLAAAVGRLNSCLAACGVGCKDRQKQLNTHQTNVMCASSK